MPPPVFKYLNGVLVILTLTFNLSRTISEIDRITVENMKKSLKAGIKYFDYFEKADKKLPNIVETASFDDITASIGAVGGLVTLSMKTPPNQFQVMKNVMNLYKKMNMKIDVLDKKLGGNKKFRKLQYFKQTYIKEAAKILHASKQLRNFLNVLQTTRCSSDTDCKKKRNAVAGHFIKYFNVTYSLDILLHGTTEKIGKIGKPWLKMIFESNNGDVSMIDSFVNGVILLAVKAQPVILAQDIITGSKRSILTGITKLRDSMYNLRTKSYRYKQLIYKSIPKCIKNNIANHTNERNPKDMIHLKKYLDQKYNWLNWIVFTFKNLNMRKDVNQFTTIGGKFYSKHKGKKERIIIASPQGEGSYFQQRDGFRKTLKEVAESLKLTSNQRQQSSYIFLKIKQALKEKSLWNYIRTLAVLSPDSQFQVAIGKQQALHWFNEETSLSVCEHESWCWKSVVRIVAVFRSLEETKYKNCLKSCNNQGECKLKPLSAAMYCECKDSWHGENCENHSHFQLANSVDVMFTELYDVFGLVGYQFNLWKLQTMFGSSINNLEPAIVAATRLLTVSLQNFPPGLNINFKMPQQNLMYFYHKAIHEILYYSQEFFSGKSVSVSPKGYSKQKHMDLAKFLLKPSALRQWLYTLNLLIMGRKEMFLNHKSALLITMEKLRARACSSVYKDLIYKVWRYLQSIQFNGYLIWIRALDYLEKSTKGVSERFRRVTQNQIKHLRALTCRFNIKHSVNGNCDSVFSAFPGMTIDLKCKKNFYITGTKTPSCNKLSMCVNCRCHLQGSLSQQCDSMGKCQCKKKYYGKKCSDRDCEWSSWQSWSSCSKQCDYNGIRTRHRSYAVTKLGNGKHCIGDKSQTKSCFNGCCKGQFHCSEKKKCISSVSKCNYYNNCGNKQDERSCNEACVYRYTKWDLNGRGNVIYLDRQYPRCNTNEMMTMFHMQRSGHHNIRYQYQCCKLNHVVCDNKLHRNGATYDGRGNSVFLDRQVINCGSHDAFLHDFRLLRRNPSGKGFDHIAYFYHCCKIRKPWRSLMHCYSSSTGFTVDGGGKNYYLDRQTVRCSSRYFLNYFHLNRGHGGSKWRFSFRCCKIVP